MATVKGLSKILKNLEVSGVDATEASLAALLQEGYDIDRKSVRLVPVKSGDLKRSHYVARPTLSDPTVEIGYGTNYAVPVHERVEVPHKNGQAMFLKQPVDEAEGGMLSRLVDRAKRNLERGIKINSIGRGAPETPGE
jgi:hypothetical protein